MDMRTPEQRATPWTAALVGGLLGIGITLLFAVFWNPDALDGRTDQVRVEHAVAFFRLPGGSQHELYVLPAGPEGRGEDRLAEALFPDESPRPGLVSVYAANLSDAEDWSVDLLATPIRVQTADGWAPLRPARPELVSHAADALRARTLGAGKSSVVLPPGRAGRMLLALPAGRTFEDVSDVQWGDRTLLPDRRTDEQVRAMQIDPAASAPGR